MKLHLNADAWHSPRNPAKQEWVSLPGIVMFFAHFIFGRRAVEPSERQPAAPVAGALAVPPQEGLDLRMARCRQRLLDANLQARLPDELIEESVTLVAAIAARVIGLTPTRAQLAAARGMLDKNLVQLAPGEGKTLAIAMVGVILAWRNRPCHVVTANEYLAERDAVLMEPLYTFCGLTTRSITTKDDPALSGQLYKANVVYATANQLLADFLRDDLLIQGAGSAAGRLLWKFRQRQPTAQPVMPGLCSAIIDEADSVLIDEATTPLIISYPEEDRSDFLSAIAVANRCMALMIPRIDYELVADASQAIRFTLTGLIKIREFAQLLNPYWQREGRAQELFKTMVTAREFFIRDRNYIVRDGEVVIIDNHTGRATPGRNWSNGIHQAVEAKEGLELTQPSKTVARMTFQTFFRHYHFLCGASGTLHGLDIELWFTYGLKIQRVPSNTRSKLHIRQRRVFNTQAEKFIGLVDLVVALHRQHVPVLVGTRRIEDSEKVADALALRGLACTTLNAKLHEFESQVIELAGRVDSITVATDMAGRGSDIQIEPHVEAMGGLHVLMYESHESARVDWQLYGRAGRQGAQGVAYPLLALDDELLKRHLPKPLAWIMHTAFERLALNSVVSACVWFAQGRAQRHAMQQRKQLNHVQGELRKTAQLREGLVMTHQREVPADANDTKNQLTKDDIVSLNKKSPRNRIPDSFKVERLESRVMLSADPVLTPLALALMPHAMHLTNTAHAGSDAVSTLKTGQRASASHVLFNSASIDDHQYVLHPAQSVATHDMAAGTVAAAVHPTTPASTFASVQGAASVMTADSKAATTNAVAQAGPLVAAATTSLASAPGRMHILTADPASTTTWTTNQSLNGFYSLPGGSLKLDLSPLLTVTMNPSPTSNITLGNSNGFVFATTTNQNLVIVPSAAGSATVSFPGTLAGLQATGYDAVHDLTIGSAAHPVTNVSFGGAVNLTGTLTIYATGTVTFGNALNITNNGSVAIHGANTVSFQGPVSLNNQDGTSTTVGTTVGGTAGDIFVQADTITFTSVASSFAGSGKLTLLATTAARAILFASPTGVSSANSLVIDNTAISSWATTFSSISIGSFSGSHADAAAAGPVSIGATANYGLVGAPTVQDAITFYGSTISVVAAPPFTGSQYTFFGTSSIGFDAVNNITFANTVIANSNANVAQNITAYSANGSITATGTGTFVSAAVLTATAASGITLPATEIASLTATNTGTTGSINVTQDGVGGALNVLLATQTAASGTGGIAIATTSGNLTVASAGTGVVDLGTGAINLAAHGTAAALSVQQVVTSHAGAITMSTPGLLTIGAVTSTLGGGVSLTSSLGAIAINANVLAAGGLLQLNASTDIAMAAGTLLSSINGGNTGAIALLAGGNDVLSTLAAGGTIGVTATTGAISSALLESTSSSQLNLVGSTARATLTSARGIGTRGHDIQTQLSEITLTNSVQGDVFVNQTQTGTLQLGTGTGNAVTLGGATGTASIVTTDGGITVNGAIAASGGTAGTTGHLLLQSSKVAASTADIIVNANVSTTTGSIEIKSGGTLDVGLASAITIGAIATGQTVYLQAVANVVFLGLSQVNAAGNVWVSATGGRVVLGEIASTAGIVAIDAGDVITDAQSNASQTVANITAANVRLASVNGIGTSSNFVEVANGSAGLTYAGVSTSGGMYLLSQSDLTVGSVGATPVYVTGPATPTTTGDATSLASVAVYGASNLVLKSNADLTVATPIGLAAPVTIVTTPTSSQVRLDASGQLNVNAGIGNIGGAFTFYTGNMSLLGSAGVAIAPNVVVNTINGTLDVESGAGSVLMGASSFLNSTNGAIRVIAAHDVGLAKVRTTGNVAVTATAGSITDTNGNANGTLGPLNVQSSGLRLASGTDTGTTGDALQVHVDTLTAAAAAGSIYVFDTVAATTDSVSVTVQQVGITGATSPITDVAQDGITTSGANGNIVLQSGAGDLTLNGAISANGSGNVLLQQVSGIVDVEGLVSSGSGSISVLGTGGVFVGQDITTGGAGSVDVESSAGAFDMGAGTRIGSGSGAIRVVAQGALHLTRVVTTGNVALTSVTGSITDGNGNSDAAGAGIVNVTASGLRLNAAVGVGTSTDALQTAVATTSAVAAAGGVYLLDNQAESLGSVAVTINQVGANGATSTVTDAAQAGVHVTGGGNVVVQATAGNLGVDASVDANNGGNVLLQSNAGTLAINANVTSSGSAAGSLSLLGATGVTLAAGPVSVITGSGTIDLESGAAVTMGAGSLLQSTSGSIGVLGATSVALAQVRTNQGIAVTANAGSITDAEGNLNSTSAGVENLIANSVRLKATAGIGLGTDAIRTQALNLTASAGAGGAYLMSDQSTSVSHATVVVNKVAQDGTAATTLTQALQNGITTTAGGNVVLQATAGNVSVTSTSNALPAITATGGGNVLVQSLAGTTTVSASIYSNAGSAGNGTGHISVLGATGVSVTQVGANPSIATGSGAIDVEASGGSVTMAANALIRDTSGPVRLFAAQNIAVGKVTTGGNVALWTTSGAVTDANGNASSNASGALDVSAAGLSLNAGGGVGTSGDALRTHVGTLSGGAVTGGVYVINDQGVSVAPVSMSVPQVGLDGAVALTFLTTSSMLVANTSGNIVLQATAGDITLSNVTGGIAVTTPGSGNVLVQATAGNVVAQGDVRAFSGHITLLGAQGVQVGDAIVTTAGSVDVESSAGSITMDPTARVESTVADVRLVAAQDVTLGLVSSAHDVSLTATAGRVLDGRNNSNATGSGGLNVQADGLRINAGTGAGTTLDALQVHVNTISENVGSGGAYVVGYSSTTVGTVSASVDKTGLDGATTATVDTAQAGLVSHANGNLVLDSAIGDITLTSASPSVAAVDADGTGNVLVRSRAGQVNVDANVYSGGGSGGGHVSVFASSDIDVGSTGVAVNVGTGSGTVDMESFAGSVVMSVHSVVASGGADVRIDAAQDIAVGEVQSGGNVMLTARNGSIFDNNGNANGVSGRILNVQSLGLRLSAAQGVGTSGDALQTEVDTVAASVGSGGVYLVDDQALTVGDVATSVLAVGLDGNVTQADDAAIFGITAAVDGPVVLQATSGDVSVASAITASGNANVLVQAASGAVHVGANIVDSGTGAGDISLIGAAGVSVAAGIAVTDSTSGASSLDVESSNGSVTLGAGSTLSARSVRVIAAQDIGLGQVLSPGNVALTATAGSITNATGAANNVTASGLFLSAGTAAGTAGTGLATHVSTLSAEVGSGGMHVVNDQGLATGSVAATVGVVGLDGTTAGAATATASDAIASAGAVTLEATAGDISLNSASPSVAAINANGSGNVLVESYAGSINVNANVLDGSGNTPGGISLLALHDVHIGGANAVSIVDGAGALDIEAFNGSVTMTTASALQASVGTVRVVGDDSVTLGVVQAVGNTLAQAVTGTLNANANITVGAGTSTGTLTLHAAHDLVVAAGVAVSDGAGAVTLTSDLGNVTTATSSLLQSASGAVNVQAGQAVTLGQVNATGDTTLQAQGGALTLSNNLSDGTGTQGGLLTLLATGDIVFAAGVAVSNGAGRVDIESSGGDIALATSSTLQSAGGTLNLRAAHAVALGQVLAAANTRVQAQGGALHVDNSLTVGNGASGGSLSLLATGDVALGAVVVSSGVGSMDLESSGGSVVMNASAIVASATGAVRVLAAQDADIGMITTTGNVAITATAGNIADASHGLDVLADGLRLAAGNGIALETHASTLSARAGAGGIALVNDQSVTVGSVAVSVNQVSTTGTTSLVTDAAQAGLVTSADGSISLQALSGDITLTPAGGNAVNANGSGSVLVQALASSGNVNAFAGILSGTGAIDVEAGNNIVLYTPGSAAAQIATALPGLITVHAINGTVISGGVTQPGQTVNLNSNQITLDAPLVGTDNQLNIGPATVASNPDAVVVGGPASGGTGALYLSQAQIALIQAGFTDVDIGSTIPGQALHFVGQDAGGNASANVFVNPLTLTASGAGGTVSISGGLQSTTLDIEGSRTGTTLASAAVSTRGATVINDNVIVTGATSITSGTGGAANLTVNGTITGSGSNALTLSANGGAVVVTGAVSGLGALTVTQAASLTFQSTLAVTGNVVINTTGTVTFAGGVTIAAGGSLTINGANVVTFAAGADFTQAGNVTIAATVLNLNGGAGSVHGAGVLTLQGATLGGAIHVGAGSVGGALNIGAQTVSAIAPGFSQVVIGTVDSGTGHAAAGSGAVDITGSFGLTAFAAPLAVYGSTITVATGGSGVHVGGALTLDAVGQVSLGSDVTTTVAAHVVLTSATSTVSMTAQTKLGSLGGDIDIATGNNSNASLAVVDSRATGSDVGAIVHVDVGTGHAIDVNADANVNIYGSAVSLKGYGIANTAGSSQNAVLKVRAPVVYVASPTGTVVADSGLDGRTNYNALDHGTMYEELIAVGATTRVTLPGDAVPGGGPESVGGQGGDYSLMHAAAFVARLVSPALASTDADGLSLSLGDAAAEDAALSGYVLGTATSHPSASGVDSFGEGAVDYWTEALSA